MSEDVCVCVYYKVGECVGVCVGAGAVWDFLFCVYVCVC